MYFPFFKPQTGGKRSATQPQTIYSEVPFEFIGNTAQLRRRASPDLFAELCFF